MEPMSLQALLESDRDMILSNLARDRSPAAAQTVLEKAVDRVMYRYVEQCQDPQLRDEAQYILQSVRNTLPLIDAVSEARDWEKKPDASGGGKGKLRPAALALLLAGAVLVLASALAGLVGGGRGGALGFIRALVPVVLGGAALYWSGVLTARPEKRREKTAAQVRTEFLVDPEKSFHCLRGALVMADHQLDTIRQETAVQRQKATEAEGKGGLSRKELDFFSELLESAYGTEDEGAREMISGIRFFLHGAQIDAADYEPGRESWFEFLPASRPGTLRPALVRDGALLKKGLASAGRD